jgi:hypothetical protein
MAHVGTDRPDVVQRGFDVYWRTGNESAVIEGFALGEPTAQVDAAYHLLKSKDDVHHVDSLTAFWSFVFRDPSIRVRARLSRTSQLSR